MYVPPPSKAHCILLGDLQCNDLLEQAKLPEVYLMMAIKINLGNAFGPVTSLAALAGLERPLWSIISQQPYDLCLMKPLDDLP